ncbi:hypothetical protein N7490_004112 [Penicillium lividum]|nr:hypothetical protein N7490_004112 [Penicillium lividum]
MNQSQEEMDVIEVEIVANRGARAELYVKKELHSQNGEHELTCDCGHCVPSEELLGQISASLMKSDFWVQYSSSPR